jgi:hypothetical protein
MEHVVKPYNPKPYDYNIMQKMLQYGGFYWLLNMKSYQSTLSLSKALHMFLKKH